MEGASVSGGKQDPGAIIIIFRVKASSSQPAWTSGAVPRRVMQVYWSVGRFVANRTPANTWHWWQVPLHRRWHEEVRTP